MTTYIVTCELYPKDRRAIVEAATPKRAAHKVAEALAWNLGCSVSLKVQRLTPIHGNVAEIGEAVAIRTFGTERKYVVCFERSIKSIEEHAHE